MSVPAGWYPDPAGAPGRYRFWDGHAWGTATTDRPDAMPPATAPLTSRSQRGRAGSEYDPRFPARPPRRPWGWWLGGVALLVALVVVTVLVLRSVGGTALDEPTPGEDPTQQTCPRATPTGSPVAPSSGDRVWSGRLSYPRLPGPFGPPMADSRTPFGHDVQTQHALVERSPDGETTWVAWALIARLLAGDGFYGPEQGAEVVADCVVSLFYNNHEIDRKDTRRAAISVDGHKAYLIESHLTFDIPGIRTKGETMIVVVVDVGQQGEAGLFYGTIPHTSPQFVAPIRQALADLQVG
jgi:Protein of unknown function (DUF2510)